MLVEKRVGSKTNLSDWKYQQFEQIVKHEIMRKTFIKYKILRIRQKISFSAFMKRLTVLELLFNSVIRTHDFLLNEGSIPQYDPQFEQKQEIFDTILYDEVPTAFMAIMKINNMSSSDHSREGQKLLRSIEETEAKKMQEKIDQETNKETYTVTTKQGKVKQAVIDASRDKDIKDVLSIIFNKNNSSDLFQNIQIDKKNMYEAVPH